MKGRIFRDGFETRRGKADRQPGEDDTFTPDWNAAGAQAFMADGAVLCFVIFHGDFEHIVAAYTNAMNFRRFGAGLGFVGGARVLSWVRLAHSQILTRSIGSARW